MRRPRRISMARWSGAGLLIVMLLLNMLAVDARAGDGMKAFYTSPVYKSLREGEYDKALSRCAKLKKLKLSQDYVSFLEGLAYYLKEDFEQAIRSFTDAIWRNDKRGDALYLRARCQMKMEKYVAALLDLNKAIAIPDTVSQVALYNEKMGFSGVESYAKASLYWNRAEVCFFKGDYQPALQDVNKAIQVRPQPFDRHYLLKGYILMELNQWKLAADSFEKAHEINDKSAEALRMMSVVAFFTGQYEKDLEINRKVLALDPDNSGARTSQALDHWLLGNREKALSLLMAGSDEPGPNRNFHLGYFHHAMGNQREALSYFQKAHQAEPDILAIRSGTVERTPESSPTRAFYQEELAVATVYIETGKTPTAVEVESRPAGLVLHTLDTTPGTVSVGQAFRINLSFEADVPTEDKIVDVDFSFAISRDGKVLFTSKTIKIPADNRQKTRYQARMNPVPLAGTYVINGTVSVAGITRQIKAPLIIQ